MQNAEIGALPNELLHFFDAQYYRRLRLDLLSGQILESSFNLLCLLMCELRITVV